MKRRDFLKYISAVTALALLPSQASAQEGYDGPLWIFVQAVGGWDPTSFCDPKGYLEVEGSEGNMVQESDPMNKSYANSDIATSTSSENIKYAPLSGADDNNQQYAFSTFFDKYGAELLVINGIDTQTNGHDAGRRYMMSGRLAEGYPALSALIAGINIPSSPLAFISAGGYDVTDGVVAATRLNNLDALNELTFVNKINDETTYLQESVFKRVRDARLARNQRLIKKQKLESVKKLAQQYNLAHSGSNELAKLVEFIPDDIDTHPDKNNQVFAQGRFAMAGYKAGLTASVNIQIGGFDTHGNHDNAHIPRLARLLKGVDLLKQEAENQGISDKVVFVMGSDFGRTPGYNNGNGKDHWSVSSMMFMGAGIKGGKTIGSSTHRHDNNKINPSTLEVSKSDNAIAITYEHINLALRKLAKIDSNELVTQYYPLSNTTKSLNFFS